MTDVTKVGAAHLQRADYVYLPQSSPHQEHNLARRSRVRMVASPIGSPNHLSGIAANRVQ
jgi:uncharacterized RmlC-like cupin family protein